MQEKHPYLDLLSELDAEMFSRTFELSGKDRKSVRFRRIQAFQDSLLQIKRFCHHGDDNDWKRCLVCGICWLSDQILAVNNQRLMSVLGRSKSTINDMLMKLKYRSEPITNENKDMVTSIIPYLEHHPEELRHWTLRRMRIGRRRRAPEPEYPPEEIPETDISDMIAFSDIELSDDFLQ